MVYDLAHIKVLIADDMKPMRNLTSSVLQTFGFKDIAVASNGDEAFELYCRFNHDLVITDWIMEPTDGLELAQKIRTDPASPNKFVPIIVMTGFSAKARVEKSRDTGITEFLVKPFNAEDLYRRIFQIIEKPRKFVEAEEFFGPDRRRKIGTDYSGPRRRDEEPVDLNDKDAHKANILKKLREEAKSI